MADKQWTKLTALVDKPIPISVLETVSSKVSVDENGCWVYGGHLNHAGYGLKSYRYFGKVYAMATHKMVWAAIGKNKSVVLNHLCRNRACCNPKHLEETTARGNVLDGLSQAGVNSKKTECVAGHKFNSKNTRYYKKNGNLARACRVCALDWYHNNKKLIGVNA